jgi:pyrroline-5-carboxylate reductase
MTVWAAPEGTAAEDLDRIRSILRVMGEEILVMDEGHVDRATAVNGTGPAIVAQFVKAMLEAATFIGESRSVAQETVLSTLVGTAEMIRAGAKDGIHVAQLIDEVTSPGGTTSRALQVLKQGQFSAVLTEAVDAAYQRTLVLGENLEKRVRED